MKQRYVPVEGHSGLVKDTMTGAILNTDTRALAAYRKQKSAASDHRNKVEALEVSVRCMNEDISEIKSLLKQILGK